MQLQPLNLKDFYKTDHRRQYPPATQLVFSNLTPRGSRVPGVEYLVWFGLQYAVKEYLIRLYNEQFFGQPKGKAISRYKRRLDTSLGKDAVSMEHIDALHDLGYLPVEIWALPEGAIVPMRVPPMVLWNTHMDFAWLTNDLETLLSCTIWPMSTSATTAYRYRKLFDKYAELTGGDKNFVPWQGHDFSMRGMFGVEAAAMSGAAHLLSFTGTDTIPAIDFLEEYYRASADVEMIGGSVPATEHAVMCMGGELNERDTFCRLLLEVYPKGIVSVVSDTWDFWNVIEKTLPELKDMIMYREGKLVIRPDSGNPVDILCGVYDVVKWDGKTWRAGDLAYDEQGDPYTNYDGTDPVTDAELRGVVKCLYDIFGGTVTEKGFMQLDPHIGVIYGDSITPERALQICDRLMARGFASTNVVLGIGSYTYTYVTRDVYGIAMKATYGEVGGEARVIYKDPKTDSGVKKSARGLLAVYQNESDGQYELHENVTWEQVKRCAYVPVFKNSHLITQHSLAEIRQRLHKK